MKKWILSLSLMGLMSLLAGLGLYLIQYVEHPEPPEPAPVPVAVEVTRVMPRDFTHRIEALGTIRAIREAAIGARVSGPVSFVSPRAELGTTVKKGELLARIDPVPFRIEVKRQEALVARYRAEIRAREVEVDRQRTLIRLNHEKLRLVQAEHKRLEELEKRNLTAAQEAERAELALNRIQEELAQAQSGLQEAVAMRAVGEAELARAQAELDQAQRSLSDSQVRAPFSGAISEKRVTLGEQVAPGTVLFDLADLSTVKLVVRVPSVDVRHLKLGTTATVKVDGLPETFDGRVQYVGPKADDATRTYPVEILMDNRRLPRLFPGMFARATIPIRIYSNALLIPRSSVLADSGNLRVFIADAERGIAHRRSVTIGRTLGSNYLVEKGIEAGPSLWSRVTAYSRMGRRLP